MYQNDGGRTFTFYGIWGTIDGTKYATKGNSGYHDVPIKHSAYNRKVCFYSTRVFQNVV